VVTVSNIISIFRALFAIPIIYFLKIGRGDIALVFMLIAMTSDMLDGWLARISNQITAIGKILDPIADKVVIFSVMAYLLLNGRMPGWYFGLLLVRDSSISILGICVMNYNTGSLQSNKMGKIAVIFTSFALLAFIYNVEPWQKPLMWVSILFLLISWFEYMRTYLGNIADRRNKIVVKPGNAISEADKLKSGLLKTESRIATRLPLLGKFFRLDTEMLEKIEETLLAADVGVEFTGHLLGRLEQIDKQNAAQLDLILKQEIKYLLQQNQPAQLQILDQKPAVIMFVGVNGTGKTTAIGKIAYYFASQGEKVLTVAADTFRAAAYEQLKIWAERAGVEIIGNPQGKDPSAVVYDALKSALAKQVDKVLIDTAGRLHTKSNLMAELAKVKRTIQKIIPEAPHAVWLVLDANTGQNALLQAEEFLKTVGITGLILNKLDGTAKGGIVLSINYKLNIPIRFLGVGEKIDDLVEFEPADFVDALLSN
jgi:fused signal recognition particle receptor